MRKYIVETADGDWRIWTSTPWREVRRAVPKVKKGTITLDGCTYNIDAHRFRRLPYKPWRFLKLITEYAQVQLWFEGKSTPIELFGHELYGMEDSSDRTGVKFAELSRSERLARLVRTGFDWRDMIVVFSVLVNIILAIGLVYIANKPAGK